MSSHWGVDQHHIWRMKSQKDHLQPSVQRAGRQRTRQGRQAGSFPCALVPALEAMKLQGFEASWCIEANERGRCARVPRGFPIALRSA